MICIMLFHESLIKQSFFVHNFQLPRIQMVMHWNEYWEENEIVEREQT